MREREGEGKGRDAGAQPGLASRRQSLGIRDSGKSLGLEQAQLSASSMETSPGLFQAWGQRGPSIWQNLN